MTEGTTESPATERMMEEVCEAGNLRKALQQVGANKGAPGVDGMTVDELSEYFGHHEAELRKQLLESTYRPQPVRRVEIAKPDGGMRKLGIPTVSALCAAIQHQFGFDCCNSSIPPSNKAAAADSIRTPPGWRAALYLRVCRAHGNACRRLDRSRRAAGATAIDLRAAS